MSADIPQSGYDQRGVLAYWCPWTLHDLTIGIALILIWRCLPLLNPNPFVILPAWAQGAVLLYGPQLFYLLFPLLVLRRRKGKLRNRLPGVKRIAIETIIAIGSLAILAAVLVGIAAIIKLVSPEATLIPMTWTHRATQLGHSRLLSVLLVSSITIAPLCEEIFFRGFLHQAFRSRMPIVVAAFTQSLLFSLMHGLD
jgi:membrane protease YdiL (CAAX protease family)